MAASPLSPALESVVLEALAWLRRCGVGYVSGWLRRLARDVERDGLRGRGGLGPGGVFNLALWRTDGMLGDCGLG